MSFQEPAGAFWGCVVIAAAVMVGTVAMAHQTGKIANHLLTTLANQGDRMTNTAERMTNTSERLAMALAHHSDRLATTGERIASVAETIDINVNCKLVCSGLIAGTKRLRTRRYPAKTSDMVCCLKTTNSRDYSNSWQCYLCKKTFNDRKADFMINVLFLTVLFGVLELLQVFRVRMLTNPKV